ncbi:MAG: hypothetical protein ACHRXM_04705 [Isosphaerales bacterium]
MMTATSNCNPAWQAEVRWERRYVHMEEESAEGETVDTFLKVWDCFADVFRPGGERIRFRVNRRKGRRLTLTDPRDRTAGTAGTTGPWGTLPAPRVSRPRALTPTGFKAEVARLIGTERAEEIVRLLLE